MDYVFVFNAFEAVLWFAIAGTLIYQSSRQPELRGQMLLAAIGFIAFGLTDVVETQTGAWWRPWWLFFWKVGCVVLLVATGISAFRKRN